MMTLVNQECTGTLRKATRQWVVIALAALLVGACNQAPNVQSASTDSEKPVNPPGGHPLSDSPEPDEYGEFLARNDELLPIPINEIVKSTRQSATATVIGRQVYDKNCAACHGADMKGDPAQQAPDLTDAEWRFSGDDFESGGLIKYPSDVEWTVRYGIRSGNPNARGVEADMLAFDPQYRNEFDVGDFGKIRTVSDEEIGDLAEYVLKISGQEHDSDRATKGEALFQDNAKGNCFDCHTEEATGNAALGSTDLTRKELYLYGSDRASIIESITKGRRGVMPGFDGKLTPLELKALSAYVFSHARK